MIYRHILTTIGDYIRIPKVLLLVKTMMKKTKNYHLFLWANTSLQ
jgi:hypothetical protein